MVGPHRGTTSKRLKKQTRQRSRTQGQVSPPRRAGKVPCAHTHTRKRRPKDEGEQKIRCRGACVGHPLETRRRERVETAGVEH